MSKFLMIFIEWNIQYSIRKGKFPQIFLHDSQFFSIKKKVIFFVGFFFGKKHFTKYYRVFFFLLYNHFLTYNMHS